MKTFSVAYLTGIGNWIRIFPVLGIFLALLAKLDQKQNCGLSSRNSTGLSFAMDIFLSFLPSCFSFFPLLIFSIISCNSRNCTTISFEDSTLLNTQSINLRFMPYLQYNQCLASLWILPILATVVGSENGKGPKPDWLEWTSGFCWYMDK